MNLAGVKEVKRWLKTSWVSRTSWLPGVQLTAQQPPPHLHSFYTESRMNRQERGPRWIRWKSHTFLILGLHLTRCSGIYWMSNPGFFTQAPRPMNELTGQRKRWRRREKRIFRSISLQPFCHHLCRQQNHYVWESWRIIVWSLWICQELFTRQGPRLTWEVRKWVGEPDYSLLTCELL